MALLRRNSLCAYAFACLLFGVLCGAAAAAAAAAAVDEREQTEEIFGDIFHISSRSLSVPGPYAKHKCQREVPAIFYRTQRDEVVRGNGSTIYYHRIEVCCDGYRRARHDWRRCVPDCAPTSPDNCRHGVCVEPQRCDCYDDFVRNERGVCTHTCPIACQHGRCHLDGTCVCAPGYVLDAHTRQFCRPACEQVCGTHQECVAPGRCGCTAGYQLTAELGCQPVCTPDCGHGKCVGPNRCECFAGYTKRPQRNVCEAECYMTCENGFCESRYVCQCRDGYAYDANTTSCLPDCGDLCADGVCVAPGVCRCYDGYELLDGHCQPRCVGGCGYYGHCIAPQLCGCGSDALPHHCRNGSCLANGICACAPGRTHFVDACIDAQQLEPAAGATLAQTRHYNQQLQREFHTLIGRYFSY